MVVVSAHALLALGLMAWCGRGGRRIRPARDSTINNRSSPVQVAVPAAWSWTTWSRCSAAISICSPFVRTRSGVGSDRLATRREHDHDSLFLSRVVGPGGVGIWTWSRCRPAATFAWKSSDNMLVWGKTDGVNWVMTQNLLVQVVGPGGVGVLGTWLRCRPACSPPSSDGTVRAWGWTGSPTRRRTGTAVAVRVGRF